MTKSNYLQRLGDRWYVRVKIPRSLQGKLRNTHVRRALGTGDLSEANRLKWPVIAAIQGELARIGRGGLPEGAESGAAQPEPPSQQLPQLPSRLVGARTPASESLDKLVEQWLEGADYLAQTKQQHRHAYLELRRFLGGDRKPSEVGPQDALDYVEEVLKPSDQALATKRRKLNSLIALWEWLSLRREVPRGLNPWKGFRVGSKAAEGRQGRSKRQYELPELLRLFSARPGYEGLWEVMVIGLYTGMRLDEICSLRASDIEPDEQGGLWLHIRRAKTKAGVRSILVTHWIPVGVVSRLLRHVPGEDSSLFPWFKAGGYDGKLSWGVSKAFGRHRTKVGLTGQTDFHSFRRTFITLLENQGVDQVRIARYVGHELPTLAFAVYSGGSSAATSRATAALVEYPEGLESILAERLGL